MRRDIPTRLLITCERTLYFSFKRFSDLFLNPPRVLALASCAHSRLGFSRKLLRHVWPVTSISRQPSDSESSARGFGGAPCGRPHSFHHVAVFELYGICTEGTQQHAHHNQRQHVEHKQQPPANSTSPASRRLSTGWAPEGLFPSSTTFVCLFVPPYHRP